MGCMAWRLWPTQPPVEFTFRTEHIRNQEGTHLPITVHPDDLAKGIQGMPCLPFIYLVPEGGPSTFQGPARQTSPVLEVLIAFKDTCISALLAQTSNPSFICLREK